jgi:uncharacterized protein
MIIKIKVETNSNKNEVSGVIKNTYFIKVKDCPEKGRANKRLIKILSNYFKKDEKKIKIIFGKNSKNKMVKVS